MKGFLVFLLASFQASAATVIFTALPANYQYGTYNGFATATIDGVPAQLLVCDDFDHTTYVPSGSLEFRESSLAGKDPLQYARFVEPNGWQQSMERYKQAAVLLDGLEHTGSGLLLDGTADYQYALWHLFTPSAPFPTSTAETLLSEAAARVALPNPRDMDLFARLEIFTPTERFASDQEFLRLADAPLSGAAVATPEPGAGVLTAAGVLLILGSLAGHKLRNRKLAAVTTGNSPRASER